MLQSLLSWSLLCFWREYFCRRDDCWLHSLIYSWDRLQLLIPAHLCSISTPNFSTLWAIADIRWFSSWLHVRQIRSSCLFSLLVPFYRHCHHRISGNRSVVELSCNYLPLRSDADSDCGHLCRRWDALGCIFCRVRRSLRIDQPSGTLQGPRLLLIPCFSYIIQETRIEAFQGIDSASAAKRLSLPFSVREGWEEWTAFFGCRSDRCTKASFSSANLHGPWRTGYAQSDHSRKIWPICQAGSWWISSWSRYAAKACICSSCTFPSLLLVAWRTQRCRELIV